MTDGPKARRVFPVPERMAGALEDEGKLSKLALGETENPCRRQ